MPLIDEFLANELEPYVRGLLLRELEAKRPAYLRFNVFNVRLDPETDLVTLEDVLDPNRVEVIGLEVFRKLLDQRRSGR
ncbi:MAG: hypothetical protein ABI725_05960 [Chloroflexota bacterium]